MGSIRLSDKHNLAGVDKLPEKPIHVDAGKARNFYNIPTANAPFLF